MKAVALVFAERKVRVIDVSPPRLKRPTDVLVRTLEVGVCGTDREIVQLQHGSPPQGEERLIVGHEALGEVLEVGPEVKDLAKGDLVVPRVRRPCPHASCGPCRAGRPDFCVTGDYTERGIQGAHGFLAERFVESREYLHRVPSGLRSVAVLTEPLTIAEKALGALELVQKRLPASSERRERRCVVLGAGPVGLLGAMAFLRAGFATTVYSRTPPPNERATLAEALGAPYVSSEQTDVVALKQQRGAADVVYEAAGSAQAAFDLVSVLAPNAAFVLTGVPGRGKSSTLDGSALMGQLVMQNQVLLGTVNASAEDFRSAIADLGRFLERWGKTLEGLITARHPPEAFAEVVAGDKASGIKNVIRFDSGAS